MQYNADGTGTRTESQSFTLQSEAAVRNFGVVGLIYASASQKADFIYVRVRHPDGAVVETPLTDVQDQTPPVTQQAPFYSDLKQKQIPVRGMRIGDTVEWQTRITVTKPEAPNQFWGTVPFVRGLVTENQTVELRVPAQSSVNVWTNPTDHVTPQRASEGNETVYRWQWRSTQPTVGKEAEDAKKARAGKLLTAEEELDETQGRLPDIAFTTFPDWPSVGAWYRGMEADRTEPDAAVRARVAAITAHAGTEQEKVRAVYDWVASNIRYIGVALGIGRYQPHAAAAVLENQYGDCKDKHTLLASMLLALGEHPDAVLIGSGIRFNSAVPSPAAFNHVITRLSLDGKSTWLDSTSEVAAFGVLTPTLRDKDALVVPAAAQATVQHTPAGYPFEPFSTMAVRTTLGKDLTSDSVIVYRFHDDSEVLLRAAFRQASPAQYPELIQKLMENLGFGGTTSEPSIQNLNDQEKPLTLLFHYHRVHDPSWGQNRVTAIFGPTEVAVVDEKNPPTSSIRLGLPRDEESVIDIQLPEGWSAELPEAIHQQLSQVRIDTTYRLDGRTLHAERKTRILSDNVPAADWKKYVKWYEAASAGSVPYIQLVPPGNTKIVATGAAPAEQASAPHTEAERLAEAARLVASANQKIAANQIDSAEKDLLAAKEFNPNQKDLSGDLGAVALHRGNTTEALRLYRKETELHPDSEFAWRNVIFIESQKDRKSGEAATREWVAAQGQVLEPRATLVRMLMADKQEAAALVAAKDAAAALPGEVREGNDFQLLLGEAQLRGGETAQGAETLSHLVQSDATPLQQNDADYELARAHQHLKLAETTQRDALKKLEAETLSWTGAESAATMRNASSLLTAAWDTMGWILFQNEKYAEAESYIRAAWLYRPNPEVGEHFGDVEAALHHDREARKIYIAANIIAKLSHLENFPELRKKADAASKIEAAQPATEHGAPMNREHFFFAAPSKEVTGSAQYMVLLTPERVVSIKAINAGSTPAQDAFVRGASFAKLFPANEPAALAGRLFLNCSQGECNLQLEP